MKRGILILLAVVVAAGAIALLDAGGETPQQPIAFPHDIHSGTNQIPCMYCHSSADRSVDAGLPSMEVCAGCHIPGGVPTVAADSPDVRVLTSYWNQRRIIPWVRIHDLPDHAHFPHMLHVNAEDLECQECHGQVEAMAEIRLQQDLNMGWCLECHRDREVRTDCTVCHY
ncbi:MAG: cytochrome c3 family protein [Gemmatimonadota bacterium]